LKRRTPTPNKTTFGHRSYNCHSSATTMTLSSSAAVDFPNNNTSFFTGTSEHQQIPLHHHEEDDDARLWIWEEKEVSSLEVGDMELLIKQKRGTGGSSSNNTTSNDDDDDDVVASVSSIDSAVSSTHGVIHDMVSLTSKTGKHNKRHPHSFTIPAPGAGPIPTTPSPLGRSRRTFGVADDDTDDESSFEGGTGAPPRPPVRTSSLSNSTTTSTTIRLQQRQSSYSKQTIHTTPVNSPRSHRAKTATMLGNLMMEKDWEGVLDVLESSEGMEAACSWQYGTSTVCDEDDDIDGGGMWKRLPLHHSCSLGAPIGILDKLLEHYPEALEKADPYSGMMPLHLACKITTSRSPPANNSRSSLLLSSTNTTSRHPPSPSIVGALLSFKQGIKATKHADSRYGRLPLHWACISAASIAATTTTTKSRNTTTNNTHTHHQTKMLAAVNKIISRLLQVNPSAVVVRDEAQDMTPLEYAKAAAAGGVSTNNMQLMKKLYKFMNKVQERSSKKSSDPLHASFHGGSFSSRPERQEQQRRRHSNEENEVLHQIGTLSIANISFHNNNQQRQRRLPPPPPPPTVSK